MKWGFLISLTNIHSEAVKPWLLSFYSAPRKSLRPLSPLPPGGEKVDLVFELLYTCIQGDYGMEQTFEATIEKRDKWYIGWVDAVPGAFSQGRTIKEVEENLKEAVQLILESQRELRDRGGSGEIVKRKIQVQV